MPKRNTIEGQDRIAQISIDFSDSVSAAQQYGGHCSSSRFHFRVRAGHGAC